MKNKFCTIFLLLFSFTSHAQESPPTNENTPTPCCHESPKPCGETCAEKPKWTLGGEARFRFETRDNRDLNSGTSDHHSFVGTRVRLNVGFEPIENLKTFVQPQFSHIWGQGTANVLGNGTLTPGVVNSGGVIDPTLNLHQAYVHWKIIQPFQMILGRQEMAYGDEQGNFNPWREVSIAESLLMIIAAHPSFIINNEF